MVIRTYDNKDKATFDLKGLEEFMETCIEVKEQEKRIAINKAEAYFAGYMDGIYAVKSMLEASNYRAEAKE